MSHRGHLVGSGVLTALVAALGCSTSEANSPSATGNSSSIGSGAAANGGGGGEGGGGAAGGEHGGSGQQAGPVEVALDDHGTVVIDGKKVFPIGLSPPPIYNAMAPSGKAALAVVAEAGINFIRTGPRGVDWDARVLTDELAWQAQAHEHGLYTWVNLRELGGAAPGSAAETLLKDVVGALKDLPALAIWKGIDEPAWNSSPIPPMENSYSVVSTLDEHHVFSLIEAPRLTPDVLAKYSAVTDVHGVDVYPVAYGVANPDLHEVGRWTKTMADITPGHGVFAVLQIAFSGSDGPNGDYVMPTLQQERYVVYDAIMNGARGVMFFGGNVEAEWTAIDEQFGWAWTFWDEVLEPVVREIGPGGEVYPALLEAGTGLGLTSSDPETQVMSRRVGAKDIWVFVASRSAGMKTVTIEGLPATIQTGQVHGEDRDVTVTNGAFSDAFGQWDVHVYRFTE